MPTYFTIGDAVSALAFLLAVQLLLKPIYVFRLRAYGLKIAYLSAAVFIGALCSLIATLLPNLPFLPKGFWIYPVVWELIGGILIGVAYAVTAFISLKPARVYSFNLIPYCRAGGLLLSEANNDDRVSFANDLLQSKNIDCLIQHASAWERAERHATMVEFERLESIGKPASFSGSPPISAFYLFAHRRELELASFAITFTRLISDPEFCSVLVRKCPWLTASAVSELGDRKYHSNTFTPFVQAIACQAILHDESMMAKESSYTGFSEAPLLSSSLFENWQLLRQYDPIRGLQFNVPANPTQGFIRRLNSASEMVLKTAIANGDYWPQGYAQSLAIAYESVANRWALDRSRKQTTDYHIEFHIGVERLGTIVAEGLSKLDSRRTKLLFVTDPKKYRSDLVNSVATIIYESFACISKGFKALTMMHGIMPSTSFLTCIHFTTANLRV